MPRLRVRLFVLALLLLSFPFFLRRRPRVERRITVCATPDAIFPLINDLRNWPLWSAWSERDGIEFSYGDTIEGVGALQRWRNGKHDGSLKIIRSESGRRIDYTVKLGGGQFELLGRIDVVPDGACTRITWKSVWEPARNPYMRYVDLFFRWRMGRDFARGLARLKALVEGKATVPAPRTA